MLAEFFCFFEWLLRFNTHLIKALNSLHSFRPYGRLLENPKTGAFRELFLPENDFKTCSPVSFPKRTSRFLRPGNQQKTWNSDLNFFQMSFYIWTWFNIKVVLDNQPEHPQNAISFEDKIKILKKKKKKKKSAEEPKKLNFTIFWALYFLKWSS